LAFWEDVVEKGFVGVAVEDGSDYVDAAVEDQDGEIGGLLADGW
jgi:hypothetical protein